MNAVIFIAVFFSSLVGLQLFGISVNKIALLPLEIYLIIRYAGRPEALLVPKKAYPLFVWYGLTIISVFSGLIFLTFHGDVYLGLARSSGIANIVQILFIYIPIVVLLYGSHKESGAEVKEAVWKALILTARIQCCWAIAQLVLYYTVHFNLNRVVFVEFLGQSGSWATLNNMAGSGVLLRPTGMNHDAAFLGLLMVIGLILDRVKIWKAAYVFAILMAFSRSALLTVVGLLIYVLLYKTAHSHSGRPLTTRRTVLIVIELLAVLVLILLLLNVPFVQNQITRLSDRMDTIGTEELGTGRHTAYPMLGVEVLLTRYPFLQKLFGIGVDISGTALNVYAPLLTDISLTKSMMKSVWAIECDFAGILLGTGAIGAAAYYSMFIYTYVKNRDPETRSMVVSLFIFGFMYNYAWLTIFQIILWAFLIDGKPVPVHGFGKTGERKKHERFGTVKYI